MERTNRTRVATVLAATAVASAVAWSELASADPPSGVDSEVVSRGTLAESLRIRTRGPSDVVAVNVTIQPGGSTGWHSHPGPNLVTVKAGTVVVYDRHCRGRAFHAGQAYVTDRRAHLSRNESPSVPVELDGTMIVPPGAALDSDEKAPKRCPVT